MKLDAAAIALLEDPANHQAVVDFLARLPIGDTAGAIPPAAIAETERAIADLRASGEHGYILLRLNVPPAARPLRLRYQVIDGERTRASGADDRPVSGQQHVSENYPLPHQ